MSPYTHDSCLTSGESISQSPRKRNLPRCHRVILAKFEIMEKCFQKFRWSLCQCRLKGKDIQQECHQAGGQEGSHRQALLHWQILYFLFEVATPLQAVPCLWAEPPPTCFRERCRCLVPSSVIPLTHHSVCGVEGAEQQRPQTTQFLCRLWRLLHNSDRVWQLWWRLGAGKAEIFAM